MSWEVRTMQSKTSYFNAMLFRKNLTRFWPLWGLASFVGALFPLAVLLDMVHRGWNVLSAPDFTGMYYDAVSAVPVINLVYAALCAMAVWSYLYNARSVGLMHTLPIRREGLFLTNFLSGLSMTLIPYAVTGVLCVVVSLCGGAFDAKGLAVTVLAVLDVLYAFFLAVQCAALFGGADYLAQVGISYASYARSGFFQLVAVAAVNLACLLACLALCKGEGRGLRMVQVLGTLLVAASGVMLVSALWRMNLYVGAYGLSFKRVLTYWGMAVLAVLLAAALWKVWHRHFRWFRVLLSVGVAGWLLLNYANVDALVARYNIGRGLDTGAVLSASDGRLGALPALEELLEAQPEETELRQAVETLRDSARWQAAHWQTWSVAAWRGQ